MEGRRLFALARKSLKKTVLASALGLVLLSAAFVGLGGASNAPHEAEAKELQCVVWYGAVFCFDEIVVKG